MKNPNILFFCQCRCGLPWFKVLLQKLPSFERWSLNEKETPWDSGIPCCSGERAFSYDAIGYQKCCQRRRNQTLSSMNFTDPPLRMELYGAFNTRRLEGLSEEENTRITSYFVRQWQKCSTQHWKRSVVLRTVWQRDWRVNTNKVLLIFCWNI